MGHGHAVEIKNPGPFQVSGKLKNLFIVALAIGIAAFLAALKMDHSRAWASFLVSHFFFMSFAIGGLFFAALQWMTGAMWSTPVRRLAESMTAYLPVALLGFLVLMVGSHDLYHWTHPEAVESDTVLQAKSGYLNMVFFVIRNLVAVGIWIWFARKLIGNSITQDTTKDYGLTLKNRSWAPAFLIVFAITYTISSFDLLMSLDPHWFSTIFGVYCFAGLFYSTLALLCLFTIWLKRAGHLQGIVNENHLHDIGKFMFAFTVFWAYIGFSQFMLYWYANMPEETLYLIRRMENGWLWVSVFLLVGKFLTPFFLLMPRDAKRDEKVLVPVAVFMLFAQWVDLVWLVQPEFFKDGPKVGWIEVGVFLAFLGAFGLTVSRFLGKHNVVAIGDPRLAESVHHHHQ